MQSSKIKPNPLAESNSHSQQAATAAATAATALAKKNCSLSVAFANTLSIPSLLQILQDPVSRICQLVEGRRSHFDKDSNFEQLQFRQKKRILALQLKNALSYDEFRDAAEKLDALEENDEWKHVFDSTEYDPYLVEARLNQLEDARVSCDVGRMLFLVRTALSRNLGNMDNIRLYKHSYIGTKDLIDCYISTALNTLNTLLDVSLKSKCDRLENRHILEQILSARQAFGRSALLLSGGATFGMNHVGVLKALWEARLLPRIVSGASAGSIVCAALCTRTDEEIPHMLETFAYGDLAVFEEEGNEDGIIRRLARFLKYGAFFDISHLTRVMKDLLGDMTFQEAYNRTRRILNICVSSASVYELPRLLNYVTAPNVIIWSAVVTSCAVPLIFSAHCLLAKDPRTGEAVPWNPSPQQWMDGSVDNDLPMTRLSEMFNVNHFIVSQVNPHVIPFIAKEEEFVEEEARKPGPRRRSLLHVLTDLAKTEAIHRMHVMAELGIFPYTLTKAISVLSQKYSGDITILPQIPYGHFPYMLMNPTTEFVQQATLCGERATWQKLSRIRNHCAIELALDDAVQKLRTRVIFSPSQVKLRLNTFAAKSLPVSSSRGRRRERNHHNSSRSDELAGLMLLSRDNKEELHPNGLSHSTTRSFVRAIENETPDPVPVPVPDSVSQPRPQTPAANIVKKVRDEPPKHIEIQSPIYYSAFASGSEEERASEDLASSSSSASLDRLDRPPPDLFPFASQPVTPAINFTSSFMPTSTILPLSSPSTQKSVRAVDSSPSPSPGSSPVSLYMTPTVTASEPRHKRITNKGENTTSNNKESENGSSQNQPLGLGLGLGMILDASGTRSMMARRRSNQSLRKNVRDIS